MEFSEQEANEIDNYVQSKAHIPPVITTQNLSSINLCPDKQMYRARIQYLFELDAYVTDENGEINQEALDVLIDMIHDAILFSVDNQFSYPKSIVFLTIYIAIFQQIIIHPLYEPQKIYEKYEKCILMHSVERPPFSSSFFELADVRIIHEYFINTIFRNMKFILNCFTKRPLIEFRSQLPVSIEAPSIPLLADMEMEVDQKNIPSVESKAEVVVQDEIVPKEITKMREQSTPLSSGRHQISKSSSISRGATLSDRKQSPTPLTPQQEPTQEPEERNPEVPIEALKESMTAMHEKFITDFDDRERFLIGKIKELEIKLANKQAAASKKTVPRTPKK